MTKNINYFHMVIPYETQEDKTDIRKKLGDIVQINTSDRSDIGDFMKEIWEFLFKIPFHVNLVSSKFLKKPNGNGIQFVFKKNNVLENPIRKTMVKRVINYNLRPNAFDATFKNQNNIITIWLLNFLADNFSDEIASEKISCVVIQKTFSIVDRNETICWRIRFILDTDKLSDVEHTMKFLDNEITKYSNQSLVVARMIL